MTKRGYINLDFNDVKTVMSEMGNAVMGTGEGEGEHRSQYAVEAALENPLLDGISISGAKSILLNISGGDDIGAFEVQGAVEEIRKQLDDNVRFIFGHTIDPDLEGKFRVSLIATGMDVADAAEGDNSNLTQTATPIRRFTPAIVVGGAAGAAANTASGSVGSAGGGGSVRTATSMSAGGGGGAATALAVAVQPDEEPDTQELTLPEQETAAKPVDSVAPVETKKPAEVVSVATGAKVETAAAPVASVAPVAPVSSSVSPVESVKATETDNNDGTAAVAVSENDGTAAVAVSENGAVSDAGDTASAKAYVPPAPQTVYPTGHAAKRANDAYANSGSPVSSFWERVRAQRKEMESVLATKQVAVPSPIQVPSETETKTETATTAAPVSVAPPEASAETTAETTTVTTTPPAVSVSPPESSAATTETTATTTPAVSVTESIEADADGGKVAVATGAKVESAPAVSVSDDSDDDNDGGSVGVSETAAADEAQMRLKITPKESASLVSSENPMPKIPAFLLRK